MANYTQVIGQVAGLYIGSTPPENKTLIWYDNSVGQNKHKVWDSSKMQWVNLEQTIIPTTTYTELINRAGSTGLAVGQFQIISDKGNVLALAITSTKVQYVDLVGNILIDDLGTNIQHHVTSSNLQIDDVAGVWNTANNKLVFSFEETNTTNLNNSEFLFGKKRIGNVWKLVKWNVVKLISEVTGNELSWNNGIYFNFKKKLKDMHDVSGGVVSHDTYTAKMNTIDKSYSDEAVYSKKVPTFKNIDNQSVNAGDTLLTIVSKLNGRIVTLAKNIVDLASVQKDNTNDIKKIKGMDFPALPMSFLTSGFHVTNNMRYRNEVTGGVQYVNTGDLFKNSNLMVIVSKISNQTYHNFFDVWRMGQTYNGFPQFMVNPVDEVAGEEDSGGDRKKEVMAFIEMSGTDRRVAHAPISWPADFGWLSVDLIWTLKSDNFSAYFPEAKGAVVSISFGDMSSMINGKRFIDQEHRVMFSSDGVEDNNTFSATTNIIISKKDFLNMASISQSADLGKLHLNLLTDFTVRELFYSNANDDVVIINPSAPSGVELISYYITKSQNIYCGYSADFIATGLTLETNTSYIVEADINWSQSGTLDVNDFYITFGSNRFNLSTTHVVSSSSTGAKLKITGVFNLSSGVVNTGQISFYAKGDRDNYGYPKGDGIIDGYPKGDGIIDGYPYKGDGRVTITSVKKA